MNKNFAKTTGFILWMIFSMTGYASATSNYDEEAPDKDYVWVDGYELDDGMIAKGFYRERTRDGFVWVEGHYNTTDQWVDPHWTPAQPNQGHVWVRGHAGLDGYWIHGHWRVIRRDGYRWVAPAVVAGVLVHGHWHPIKARAGYVWSPGHRSIKGYWVPGHWRALKRTGYRWKPGHWRYGVWLPGYWKPIKVRAGRIWVGGHWGPTGWVVGFWRPKLRVGFHWHAGHWGPKGWVVGGWRQGPRIVVKRKFPRVHAIKYMYAKRHKHHRKIKHPKKFAKGKAQKKYGKKQEKVGKKMEKRGQNTGNQRLEKKGKRLQKRGKKNQKKGKKKKHNARHW